MVEKTEFGKRLRALRLQNNLSQKQLAAQIGAKNSIISFYEVGDRAPSLDVVIKLASVFHVSTDYLVGLEKTETVDISGLNENDKMIVRMLVDSLNSKNCK